MKSSIVQSTNLTSLFNETGFGLLKVTPTDYRSLISLRLFLFHRVALLKHKCAYLICIFRNCRPGHKGYQIYILIQSQKASLIIGVLLSALHLNNNLQGIVHPACSSSTNDVLFLDLFMFPFFAGLLMQVWHSMNLI